MRGGKRGALSHGEDLKRRAVKVVTGARRLAYSATVDSSAEYFRERLLEILTKYGAIYSFFLSSYLVMMLRLAG
jgi:hypothetical protein